jgi:transmembrane sensor
MNSSDLPPLSASELLRLERYFAGSLLPGEREAVERWLAAHPERAGEVALHRRIAETTAQLRPRPAGTDAAWSRVAGQLTPTQASGAGSRAISFYRSGGMGGATRTGWVVRAGAGIAATLVIGASLSVGRVIGARSGRQPFREFASAPRSRTTITLHDGTQLMLGPASHLRVPLDFGRGEREVDLDGEALFTVVHDATHPFVVRTAHATTRDIGTTFVVRAYAGDGDERVGVTEGRVAVGGGPWAGQRSAQPASTATTLGAGDVAIVSDHGVAIAHGTGVATLTAWTQGRLVFDKTPLPQVVAELTRTFDLDIRVADSALVARSITAAFADESADDVLDAITRALGARYERSGRVVVIRLGSAPTGGRQHPVAAPALATATSHPQ